MLQGGAGIPTLWASGLWGRWDYLAMDLLGSSLDRLYRKSGKNMMDLRSACSFAIQLVCPFLSISGLRPTICYADRTFGVYALAWRVAPRYPTWKLCYWSRAKTRDDIHD